MNESTATQTAEPVEWTEEEETEIMRLHIIDGLTIGHAQRVVFDKRDVTNEI